MAPRRNGTSHLALRLLAVLALLGCAKIGSAQGSWSVISVPQKPGEVIYPTALAADAAGSLFVADRAETGVGRSQKRGTQENWSTIATGGTVLGQIGGAAGLAVDGAGHFYVA